MDKTRILEIMKNEAFARCRYELFAEQARSEGLHYYAKVLEEISKNELSHFREFTRLMDITEDTLGNLNTAIQDEKKEADDIYPNLYKGSLAEGELNAARLFQQIAKIENYHKEILERLEKLLEKESPFKREEKIVWKCRTCGYIHEGKEPPNKCPGCQNGRNYYEPEDFCI